MVRARKAAVNRGCRADSSRRGRRQGALSLLLLGLACLTQRAGAWGDGDDPCPARTALGGPQPSHPGGAETLRENPALLSTGPTFSAGSGFARPFDLDGLRMIGSWIAWNPGQGGGGASVGAWYRQFEAGDLYRERLVLAGAAWKTRWVVAGAAGTLAHVALAEELSHAASGDLDLGLLATPVPWIQAGAAVRAVLGTPLGREGDPRRREILWGATAAKGVDRWLWSVSGRWSRDAGTSWAIAQEARPVSWLALRAGARLGPPVLALGAGWSRGGLRLDYSWSGDTDLGFQHGVSLGWDWKEGDGKRRREAGNPGVEGTDQQDPSGRSEPSEHQFEP